MGLRENAHHTDDTTCTCTSIQNICILDSSEKSLLPLARWQHHPVLLQLLALARLHCDMTFIFGVLVLFLRPVLLCFVHTMYTHYRLSHPCHIIYKKIIN